MIDVALLRLEYEYLGTPLDTIARNNNISPSDLENEATKFNWRACLIPLPVLSTAPEPEDIVSYNELYQEAISLRMKMFNLAKDMYLANKYAQVELTLLDNVKSSLAASDITAKDLKSLSDIYTSMLKGTSLAQIAQISFTQDENGVPTAIIRDLSGQK